MKNTSQFWLKAFPLFLVLFIDGLGLSLLFPVLVGLVLKPASSILPFTTSIDTRDFIYGSLIGIYFICWFFGTAIISDWSDKAGRKPALMICIAGTFCGYLLSTFALLTGRVWLLYLGRVIDGFTTGSQPVAQAAIVDLSSAEAKNRNLGLIISTLSIGFILGPIIGSYLSDPQLVSWFSLRTPLYFATVVSAVNLILLKVLFRTDTLKTHSKQIKKTPIHLMRAVEIFLYAFRHKNIRSLAIVFLVYQFGWSNFFSFISVFLNQKFNFSILEIGNVFILIGIGFIFGSLFLIPLMKRYFSLTMSCFIALFFTGLCCLYLYINQVYGLIWILIFLIAAFSMVAYANQLTIFSEQVDAEMQGRIMGITDSLKAFVFGVVGMSSGWIAAINFKMPIGMSIIGLLLAALILYLEHLYRTD